MARAKPAVRFIDALFTVMLIMLLVAAFYGVYRFNQILFNLFVAMVMGTLARPAHQWLQHRGLSKHLASAVILIILLVFIIGFLFLLLPLLTSQYQTLVSAVPNYFSSIRAWLVGSRNELVARIAQSLPAKLTLEDQFTNNNQDPITTLSGASRLLSAGVTTIFKTVVLLLLAYHWMLTGHEIINPSLFFFRPERRQKILAVSQQIETKLHQYLVGQGILSVSIAVMNLVMLLIIGLPNALLLALIAGLFEAIPMVGPVLGAIPAVLVALSISPTAVIWVVISSLLIQQLENNLLVPRVMDKVVGVNPFISILAIAAFTSLYGVGGAFMAIPLAAIIQLILEESLVPPQVEEESLGQNRNDLHLLRYEMQSFIAGMNRQARQPQPGDTLQRSKIDSVMEEMELVARDVDQLLAQKAGEKHD
ncbi:MAG: AI-2E family transporter [Anaerolineaceae bacterium]|nr:AI-2E family transporter [Anaerolineaceae bacterium]